MYSHQFRKFIRLSHCMTSAGTKNHNIWVKIRVVAFKVKEYIELISPLVK